MTSDLIRIELAETEQSCTSPESPRGLMLEGEALQGLGKGTTRTGGKKSYKPKPEQTNTHFIRVKKKIKKKKKKEELESSCIF